MASTKTRTKTIRLANETAEYFEKLPLNRIVECVHSLLERGELELDGEGIKISSKSGVHTDIMSQTEKISSSANDILTDFDEMASCSGISLEELVSGLFSLLEDGMIVIENGELSVVTPEWATEFENVCHDLCIPVEKAADGAIKALKRGV